MPARNIKTQKWFTGPFFGTMQHAMQHKIEKTPYLRGFFHAADRNRTGTGIATHGILSPGRLPVPPLRQEVFKRLKSKSIRALHCLFQPYTNGRRWIRTTEAYCSRFTVCPLWPLGNPPIKCLSTILTYTIFSRKMQEKCGHSSVFTR